MSYTDVLAARPRARPRGVMSLIGCANDFLSARCTNELASRGILHPTGHARDYRFGNALTRLRE